MPYIYQRNGGPLLQWGTRSPMPHVAGETRQLSGIVTDGVGAKRYPSLQAKVNDHFGGLGSYQAVGRRAGTPEILTGLGDGVSLLVKLAVVGAVIWIAAKILEPKKYKSNPSRRRRRRRGRRARTGGVVHRRRLMKRRIRSRARRAARRGSRVRTRTYRPQHIIAPAAPHGSGTIRGV